MYKEKNFVTLWIDFLPRTQDVSGFNVGQLY
jgi:hypothetical protein